MTNYQYERLSTLDSFFLTAESPETPMHIGSTAIYEAGPLQRPDGAIDVERIIAHIAARLHRIPRYRERLAYAPVAGDPVWVDYPQFDLRYHVRHTSLPKPGTDAQLKTLSGRIMSQPLDRTKPLWEVWVVEGLEGGRFGMIFKTHHCMIDGVSGVDILAVLMDPTPETRPEQPVRWLPRPTPSRMQLLLDGVRDRVQSILALGLESLQHPTETVSRLRGDLGAIAETLAASVPLASDTPLNRPLSTHRSFDWTAMDLAQIQAVKQRLGGTVNDVVLATVSGALRRFLKARNTDPAGLTFRVFVPVSLRSQPEQRNGVGNRVSGWLVDLPLGEPDARKRHALVTGATAQLKHSQQARGTEVLTGLMGLTGTNVAALSMRLSTQVRPINLVVTNVPGAPVPMYLLGARMLAIYPFVPLFVHLGLGIALLSNAATLFWGCNADRELLPDLPEFIDALQSSFRELCAAAANIDTQPAKAAEKRQPIPRKMSVVADRAQRTGRNGRRLQREAHGVEVSA